MLSKADQRILARLIAEELNRIEASRTVTAGSVRAATLTECLAMDALEALLTRVNGTGAS